MGDGMLIRLADRVRAGLRSNLRSTPLAAPAPLTRGATRPSPGRAAGGAAASAATTTPTTTATTAAGAEPLAHVLRARLRAIDAADPERHAKAFRAFLEAVLLAELGAALSGDPAFGALVDRVQRALLQHDELRAACRQAGERLLAAPDAWPLPARAPRA